MITVSKMWKHNIKNNQQLARKTTLCEPSVNCLNKGKHYKPWIKEKSSREKKDQLLMGFKHMFHPQGSVFWITGALICQTFVFQPYFLIMSASTQHTQTHTHTHINCNRCPFQKPPFVTSKRQRVPPWEKGLGACWEKVYNDTWGYNDSLLIYEHKSPPS